MRRPFLFLFALSGFSGLIYETVWTHFLKLFLGHAANAQAAVLALFMGGMAIGAWGASRLARRRGNLLRGYALVELAIGAGALAFPACFGHSVDYSFSTILPAIRSPLAGDAFTWALAGGLVLPQSILLGATFPLMAEGMLRTWPEKPGRTIAHLYFLNSLGAVFGGLASGFWLVGHLGLPGTVWAAGAVNIAIGAAVLLLAPSTGPDPGGADGPPELRDGGFTGFLAVAMLTGLASFLYEIGWIRMLSLVLGSSTHAFELMLCAFILGLALGALRVSGRIDRLASPERTLGYVQVAMGLCALATLPVYGLTFDAMDAALARLEPTEGGFVLFNLLSHGLALVVMLPATFCAGMVLPLVTGALLRRGQGKRAIGLVYAWNTLGAVAGVFIGVHVGFPFLGLKGMIGAGAFLDIAVGIGILRGLRPGAAISRGRMAAVAGGAAFLFVSALVFVRLDAHKMASGVFRGGHALEGRERVVSQADGKTATISITEAGGVYALRTNGKPDASLRVHGSMTAAAVTTLGDEATMTLLGVLPVALHPGARRAAVIGLGCGLTTHTLLLSPSLRRVDTVEIEPEVVRAARRFGARVDRGFADPRSRIVIDDAKSFFATGREKYDLIVSEPSNPWVSGVAGLFTADFYRQVRGHLADGGVFAQWIHLYDLDVDLVVSVLKALEMNFDDFVVYAANDVDIIIAARNGLPLAEPDPGYCFGIPAVAEGLREISVRSSQDLAFRKVGNRRTLSGLVARSRVPPNSDYRPVLDQGVARSRFMRRSAYAVAAHARVPLPAFEFLSGEVRRAGRTAVTPSESFNETFMANDAMALRDRFLGGNPDFRVSGILPRLAEDASIVEGMFSGKGAGAAHDRRLTALYGVGTLMASFLSPAELESVWRRLETGAGAGGLSPAERRWMRLLEAVGRRDAAEMGLRAADLLDAADAPGPVPLEYLVLAGSLGAMVAGDRELAGRMAPLLGDDTVVTSGEGRALREAVLSGNGAGEDARTAPPPRSATRPSGAAGQ